jgi:hypothetical protein
MGPPSTPPQSQSDRGRLLRFNVWRNIFGRQRVAGQLAEHLPLN